MPISEEAQQAKPKKPLNGYFKLLVKIKQENEGMDRKRLTDKVKS